MEVKTGDEFYLTSTGQIEIYRLVKIGKGEDYDNKKVTKQIIYTFETYRNGIRTSRPEFSMGKKWFEDLLNRHIWKRVKS